jgi:hypothetical protein
MELDWLTNVDWPYAVLLALFALVASAIGNLLAFGHRGMGAVLTAVIFGVGFVFWTYYPHHVPLLPTRLKAETSAVTAPAVPAAPAAPVRPRNPVTTISPSPANPAPPANPQ